MKGREKELEKVVTTLKALKHLEIHLIPSNLIKQIGHKTYFYFIFNLFMRLGGC